MFTWNLEYKLQQVRLDNFKTLKVQLKLQVHHCCPHSEPFLLHGVEEGA